MVRHKTRLRQLYILVTAGMPITGQSEPEPAVTSEVSSSQAHLQACPSPCHPSHRGVSEQHKYCALEESWRGSRGGREADGPAGSSEPGSQPCLPCRLPWCAQPQHSCSRIWSQHTSSQHVMASFPKQQFPLFLFGVYCFVIWGTGIHDQIGNVVSISL